MTCPSTASGRSAHDAFVEHIEAFNEHDTDRLLAGLTDDARWLTGADTFSGKDDLAGLFGADLWALKPSLTTVNLLVQADRVAAELREQLLVGSETVSFPVAVFLNISGGLIRAAKVYREGSADIPGA